MQTTQTDQPLRTFTELTAALNTIEEGMLVCLSGAFDNDGTPLIAPYSHAELDRDSKIIGIARSRLIAGNTQIGVRLLGKGGTVRMKQSAAIAHGAFVMPHFDGSNEDLGQVETYAVNQYQGAVGIKIGPSSGGAAGDIIEVLDYPSSVAAFVETELTGATIDFATIQGLAVSNPPTQAEVTAIRTALGLVAERVQTLRANLVTAGVLFTD